MDVVKISLEALLQRATNPLNQNIDKAAVEAFCGLINKEKDGPLLGIKLLATRLHSKQEQEVLQTLHIVDYSMQKCGTPFQSEVGKFRFLNEMIKLVSPKYLGIYTPVLVKQKVLQLMYLWTLDYPKESKIKEAYDMLKKQGVIKEVPLSVSAESYGVPDKKPSTIFQDDEKSKLLQKLLQSKNPEDLQAANRLIKTMVKEDEKKAELKSRRISELESVQNNVRLLNEMLDSYKPGISSQDDYDLIKELHESCERLRPNVLKLASETQQNEDILVEILHANDDLGQVFEKYTSIILQRNEASKDETTEASQLSLLDLSSHSSTNLHPITNDNATIYSSIDDLCDILNTPNITEGPSLIEDEATILKPTSISLLLDTNGDSEKVNSKLKAFEDLDALGEHLLKENLQSASRIGPYFNKIPEKVPMNLLKKTSPSCEKPSDPISTLDFSSLLENPKSLVATELKLDLSSDDLLVDITEDALDDNPSNPSEKTEENQMINKPELKLSDIFVDLTTVKPSKVEPITAMEERSGISVTLHFAKDTPHQDVTVIVVTIVSKNELPLKNVLFRAIVPKVCKVKLQPPSATDLPSFNPFLPPSAITQIMLIANPEKVQVSLKFIVSYNIEDETMTEMGEVDPMPTIPYLQNSV